MSENLYTEEYTAYQLERSAFRQWVRNNLYIKNMIRFTTGPTIDFGCGVGEVLEQLPAGSLGLEINETTVAYCQSRGLNVRLYDPEADDYQFRGLIPGQFKSLLMAHVLEHLTNPQEVIRKLLTTGERLGIDRFIFVVPGVKGFRHDATHRTFLDRDFFVKHGLTTYGSYHLIHQKYFPLNSKAFSRYFTHNELVSVYERAKANSDS
ncbi:methyltransferase domain-containing protein [Spirosoma taeanense]|uniref:Methyltransferase domain-containing protein n=1 Tax=Spirosoma taeanense TaxID=2735870 RepID=A0A6M5YEF4_9BACT|nr:methionine biosynthesis protein MetW [Spirosoma taeanense]QJW91710.1 methyltransferase domain-containing protein [Spirosoma taeanense]